MKIWCTKMSLKLTSIQLNDGIWYAFFMTFGLKIINLFLFGTKPLHEPVLTYNLQGIVAYIWGQFCSKCLRHHWLNFFWYCIFEFKSQLSGANELTHCGPVVWQWSGSTLAQVLVWCPNHYLNQCWLIISEVLWHSSQSTFSVSTQATVLCAA